MRPQRRLWPRSSQAQTPRSCSRGMACRAVPPSIKFRPPPQAMCLRPPTGRPSGDPPRSMSTSTRIGTGAPAGCIYRSCPKSSRGGKSTSRTASMASSRALRARPSPLSSFPTCTLIALTIRSHGACLRTMKGSPAACPTSPRRARSPKAGNSSRPTPPVTVWPSRWSTTS